MDRSKFAHTTPNQRGATLFEYVMLIAIVCVAVIPAIKTAAFKIACAIQSEDQSLSPNYGGVGAIASCPVAGTGGGDG